MINISFTSPNAFFELLKYAREMNMCMKPYCTTCGCGPFRNLCQSIIGKDNLVTALKSVTHEELVKHDIGEWRDPLTIILGDLWVDAPESCPLIEAYQEYHRTRAMEKHKHLEAIEHCDSQKRLILAEKRNAQEKRRALRNDQHENAMVLFNRMNLRDKLLTMSQDKQNLPTYYPLSLVDVTEAALGEIDKDALWLIYESFNRLKKHEWKEFALRIHAILTEA